MAKGNSTDDWGAHIGDGLKAVANGVVAEYRDDLVDYATDMFPEAADTLNQIGNLASEHPYATAGFGAGLLIVATVATQAGLEEYGDNLNIDTVKLPLPPYQNDNLTIPGTNITIGIRVNGEIKVFLDTAQLYLNMEIKF